MVYIVGREDWWHVGRRAGPGIAPKKNTMPRACVAPVPKTIKKTCKNATNAWDVCKSTPHFLDRVAWCESYTFILLGTSAHRPGVSLIGLLGVKATP